jgi:hypothetical protein
MIRIEIKINWFHFEIVYKHKERCGDNYDSLHPKTCKPEIQIYLIEKIHSKNFTWDQPQNWLIFLPHYDFLSDLFVYHKAYNLSYEPKNWQPFV